MLPFSSLFSYLLLDVLISCLNYTYRFQVLELLDIRFA